MPIVQTIASTISAIVFIISVSVAYVQLRRARTNQREATARAIFNDYLKVAIQYPHLSFLERLEGKFDFDNKTIDGNSEEFERYEWFVSLMVFSMREILDIFEGDYYWSETAKRQISYHMQYIRWRYKVKMFNFILLAGKRVNDIVLEFGVNDEIKGQMLDVIPVIEEKKKVTALWKKIDQLIHGR